MSMVGNRYECQCCGRIAFFTDEYTGHGPDDPSGYYYEFEGELGTRWISATSAAIRFKRIGGGVKATEHQRTQDSKKRPKLAVQRT